MHIVIVNRWPRFDADSTRWDNELTRYEEYIDHQAHKVSYVVDANGAKGVLAPHNSIAGYIQVDEVNDVDQLLAACQRISAEQGPIDRLIALSEFTLEIAAQVRLALDIPGPKPDEVSTYRDKARMKELVAQQGLRAPRYALADDSNLFFKAQQWGFPVILKPRYGAASIGVKKITDRADLISALADVNPGAYEVEEFITGDIYHIDGYVDGDGRVIFQVVSKYINDCLSFTDGKPLGSFVIDDSSLRRAIESFSIQCCQVLNLRRTPFHLEVFWHDDEPVFLEIGARVGGAEVPHLLNRLYNFNIFEYWLRELSGEKVSVPALDRELSLAGGWVIFPKPEDAPARVITATSLKQQLPSIWRQLIPPPGHVFTPGGSYDALHCGRFIVTDTTADQVEQTLHQIISTFGCQLEPLRLAEKNSA
ncbi:MAG: ATP-grasp domain-containing protein [Wenzhouxiangellaceae bacterium]